MVIFATCAFDELLRRTGLSVGSSPPCEIERQENIDAVAVRATGARRLKRKAVKVSVLFPFAAQLRRKISVLFLMVRDLGRV